MKRLSGLVVALALVVSACDAVIPGLIRGSGNVVTQDFDVSGFSAVELSTIGRVQVTKGAAKSVSVETDDNLFPYLRIRVENHRLILAEKPGVNLEPTRDITFRVTAKGINAIEVNSSGSLSAPSLNSDALDIALSGSGGVTVDQAKARKCTVSSSGSGAITLNQFTCNSLSLQMSGSGAVEMAGETDSLTVGVSGSGEARMADLKAATVRATLSGSGDVTLQAADALDATLTGSGSLYYYGTPTVTQSVSGSGTLKAQGER